MLVKYVTSSNVTALQVITDFALLCTGAAVSDLSASCDKTYTTIIAKTVNPGWSMVDNYPTNNTVVISGPDADGVTKYVRFQATSGTTLYLDCMEAWNATTHTTTTATYTQQALGVINGVRTTYFVYVTPRTIYVARPSAVNAGTVSHSGVGVTEVTRDAGYLKGTTYPTQGVVSEATWVPGNTGGTYACWMPRMKNQAATGDLTGSSAAAYMAGIAPKYSSGVTATPNRTHRTGNDTQYYDLRDLYLVTQMLGGNGTILGKVYDAKELALSALNSGETFSDGTDTYIAFTGSYATIAFKVA